MEFTVLGNSLGYVYIRMPQRKREIEREAIGAKNLGKKKKMKKNQSSSFV